MSDMNFASLSPTLLARKGGAKPAMRRQSMAVSGAFAASVAAAPAGTQDDPLDDLGWNDLGDTPEQVPHANDAGDDAAGEDCAPLGQHARSTSAEDADASKVTPIRKGAPRLPRPKLAVSNVSQTNGAPSASGPIAGKRTAFTLRLDPERHLKLRMASTLAGRSAQVLVTQAVDAMFADIPELDALVARVQSRPQQEG